jgi:ATP-dependent helicase/DNAse subunit B
MSYFITYVLGHQQLSGKRADIGTVVHKVMEILASFKKELQNNPKAKKLEIVDDALGSLSTTKHILYKENIVKQLVTASFDYYSKRSPHNSFSSKDQEECLSMCWAALNYNEGQFDPRNRNIVETEPHFDIPIEEDWAKYKYVIDGKTIEGQLAIKGTIDLITKIDDKTIEIVDYKTGKRLDWATGEEKTYAKLNVDPQLLLYNYAVSKMFPEYDQAIMSIFYIKDGGPFSLCFDKSDHGKFLDMLKEKVQEIQKNNKPKPVSIDRSNWKCTKLCHYYKNNWPGTDQNMCTHIENSLKANGMDQTVKDCSKDGFDIGFYSAPG